MEGSLLIVLVWSVLLSVGTLCTVRFLDSEEVSWRQCVPRVLVCWISALVVNEFLARSIGPLGTIIAVCLAGAMFARLFDVGIGRGLWWAVGGIGFLEIVLWLSLIAAGRHGLALY